MTNTGKVLIIGLLVIDLGVGGYLLFPKDDQDPAAPGTVAGDPATAAGLDTPTSATHVAAGSVVTSPAVATNTPPVSGSGSGSGNDQLAMAQPADPRPLDAPAIAVTPVVPATPASPAAAVATTAPVVPVAPMVPAVNGSTASSLSTGSTYSGRIATHATDQPRAASHAPATVESRRNARSKSKPATQLAEQEHGRKHDTAHRRDSKQVSSAMTAQLVRESAKPDPSLPLPPSSRTGPGSHPVSAAMTDQLVRESSRVTPASGFPWKSDKH